MYLVRQIVASDISILFGQYLFLIVKLLVEDRWNCYVTWNNRIGLPNDVTDVNDNEKTFF